MHQCMLVPPDMYQLRSLYIYIYTQYSFIVLCVGCNYFFSIKQIICFNTFQVVIIPLPHNSVSTWPDGTRPQSSGESSRKRPGDGTKINKALFSKRCFTFQPPDRPLIMWVCLYLELVCFGVCASETVGALLCPWEFR